MYRLRRNAAYAGRVSIDAAAPGPLTVRTVAIDDPGDLLALLPHVEYVTMNGYGGPKLPLPPYATGSAASPLMALLRAKTRERLSA